jgi:hypothetical protein
MGRQTNFYMVHQDEMDFVSHIQKVADVLLLSYVIRDPEKLNSNRIDVSSMLNESHYWLWNRDISPTPVLRYVERQKYWVINDTNSEVVQFSKCHIERGIMRKGRIWADFTGAISEMGEDRWKSEKFSKWYESLAKWIKKNGKRMPSGVYLMPNAAIAAHGGLVLA